MPRLAKALLELGARGDAMLAAIRAVMLAAQLDDLTPLGNARALRARLDDVALAPSPFDLVFGDLTGFKVVNDQHGHDAGNAVISAAGRWLAALCSELGGEAFRQSGDEFVLLVPRQSRDAVAQRLTLETVDPVLYEATPIDVRINFGLAPIERDPYEALRRAESACLVAKQRGLRFLVWDPRQLRNSSIELRFRCQSCAASVRVETHSAEGSASLSCPVCHQLQS